MLPKVEADLQGGHGRAAAPPTIELAPPAAPRKKKKNQFSVLDYCKNKSALCPQTAEIIETSNALEGITLNSTVGGIPRL